MEKARELVAAIGVGAEPEPPIGRQGRALQGQSVKELFRRIVGRKPRCQHGRGQEHRYGHQPEDGEPVTPESMPKLIHAELSRRRDDYTSRQK